MITPFMTQSLPLPSAAVQKARDEAVMQPIYARGDRLMLIVILIHAALSVAFAFFYDTWLVTGLVGGAAVAMFLVSVMLMPRAFVTRCVAGVSLQTFVALHIYQLHGLAEMHFFYFTAFTLMIVYQDWVSMWPGTLLIIGQHILFAVLTNSGQQLFFFEDPYIGPTKLFFHFGIALAQTIICGYWAYLLRRQTLKDHAQQDGLKQRADREALINRINAAMRSSQDTNAIQQVAVTELGRALEADSCYFVLIDREGDHVWVGQDWHREGVSSHAGEYRISDQPTAFDQFQSRKTVVMTSEEDSKTEAARFHVRRLGQSAAIKVPLFDEETLTAVLTVAMTEGARAWTPEEIALTESVATQTRTAVETARVRQRERGVTTALQDALRPPSPERVAGLNLASFYKPALAEASIGGDFFDVFPLAEGCTALVVGDVSGKGLAAAVQVATVRNMLRYALYQNQSVAEAVSGLNRAITEHDLMRGFATLFVGRYDAVAQTLTYVSCGHEPGLLRRAASGAVDELMPTGTILGADADARYEEVVAEMQAGDALAVYTDGMTDAGPSFQDFLGVSGLSRLLGMAEATTDAEILRRHLVAGVEGYAAGRLRDDACLLVAISEGPVLRLASPPPALREGAGTALAWAA